MGLRNGQTAGVEGEGRQAQQRKSQVERAAEKSLWHACRAQEGQQQAGVEGCAGQVGAVEGIRGSQEVKQAKHHREAKR